MKFKGIEARERQRIPLTQRCRREQHGLALVSFLILMMVLFSLGIALLTLVNSRVREARRAEARAMTLNAAEGAAGRLLLEVWKPFKTTQRFTSTKNAYQYASMASPKGAPGSVDTPLTGSVDGNGTTGSVQYRTGVVNFRMVGSYSADVTIWATSWLDLDGSLGSGPNGGEPSSTVVLRTRFLLKQSHVFDYVYFVNNYGWMTGFNQNNLWVNGDMRSNGDFSVNGGTINGQIVAAPNAHIKNGGGTYGVQGIATVTGTTSMTNATYATSIQGVEPRARQAYNATQHGLKNSSEFSKWRDILYDQTAVYDKDVTMKDPIYGAAIGDKNGWRQVANQSSLITGGDLSPPEYMEMPDLNDITFYRDTVSATYVDSRTTFKDGTTNPDAGQVAYLEVWDSATGSYVRLSGQNGDAPGVVSASAALIGDTSHPIRIHGPVTVMGDIAIKGVVEGQGTLYAKRNIHIVGDVTYKDPPAFNGSNPDTMDNANQKKTVLGLAARGSVMMGDTTAFSTNPLQYMKPPFTQDRKDPVTGVVTPAFNATSSDTGYVIHGVTGLTDVTKGLVPKKYQSLFGDAWIKAKATPIKQIDAIIYTNNCAGGLVGDNGITINGSIIAKDEAMVVNLGAGKLKWNYDVRIKERGGGVADEPLIDIQLPRSPDKRYLRWMEVR